jgi:hypothetical protein
MVKPLIEEHTMKANENEIPEESILSDDEAVSIVLHEIIASKQDLFQQLESSVQQSYISFTLQSL